MLHNQEAENCYWEVTKNISFPHGFFSRRGGVSKGIYEGLNCGPGSNDEPCNIRENRRIIANLIGKRRDTSIVSNYQIHSNIVTYVDHNWGDDRPQADAMVTDQPGLILGVLTADCTPIIFADMNNNIIGAAHAGWKGAFTDIIEATIQAMEKIGASRSSIVAATGPTIAQESYEVSESFRANFMTVSKKFDQFFTPGIDSEHFQFNLPAFIQAKLVSSDIHSFEQSQTDTYQSDDHFSYRLTTHKGESDYGRQLSAIMLPEAKL
jgi:YfiH family protein